MTLPAWVAALHTYATMADVLFVVLVVAARALPKQVRPWYRAILLLACTGLAPKYSLFAWLLWTSSFVLAAALVLTLRNPDAFRDES